MQPVDDYSFCITKIEELTRALKTKCLHAEIEDSFESCADIVETVSSLLSEADKLMQLYARKAKERA